MTRHEFNVAPFDRTGKLLSNPLTGFLFLFAGLLWWVLPFPFAPRGYRVSPEGITIRALVTSYVIPKSKIKRVEIVEGVKPGVGLTLLAGLFGYAGVFALADGSTAKVFATRWDRMVQVKTSREIYLLSPAKPEVFVSTTDRVLLEEQTDVEVRR